MTTRLAAKPAQPRGPATCADNPPLGRNLHHPAGRATLCRFSADARVAPRRSAVRRRRRAQLLTLGMSSSAIDRWLATRGGSTVIHAGVYLARPSRPGAARARAWLPFLPPATTPSSASDRSACSWASSRRYDERRSTSRPADTAAGPGASSVHTSRPPRAPRHSPVATTCRSPRPPAPSSTSPRSPTPRSSSAPSRHAFARRRVTERQLRAVIARHARSPGRRRLAALLDYRGDTGFTRSDGRGPPCARLLRRAPTCLSRSSNAKVARLRGRLLLGEASGGRRGRLRGSTTRAADRSRHATGRKWADLQAQGYEVVPVTWRQLSTSPTATIARIAAAVALASTR